jgi:hypothetical protein
MNYNLNAQDKKKVKARFSAWLEIQDEKEELKDAEKAAKESVKDILDCKIGQVGKLFKLMQKYYNGAAEEEEDIWAAMESIRSGDAEEDSDSEEEVDVEEDS